MSDMLTRARTNLSWSEISDLRRWAIETVRHQGHEGADNIDQWIKDAERLVAYLRSPQ
jgi:hypothetical protein